MPQFPQININGTAAGALMQECMDALAAVDTALTYVGKMTVHGRDYQTLPPGSFAIAEREHASRLARLLTVKDELNAIAENIQQQATERSRHV